MELVLSATVASEADIHRVIRDTDRPTELGFTVAPNTALGATGGISKLVRMGGGGSGTLKNPEVLYLKAEALKFVQGKLDQLQRWKMDFDRKGTDLVEKLEQLQDWLENGGPGVPRGYEASCYKGPTAHYVDIHQELDDEEAHVKELYQQISLIMEADPSSPFSDDGYHSNDMCFHREEMEQRDLARLNVAFLTLKRNVAAQASSMLQDGIRALRREFIQEPTHLGAGDANFVRFKDLPMCPAEVMTGHDI